MLTTYAAPLPTIAAPLCEVALNFHVTQSAINTSLTDSYLLTPKELSEKIEAQSLNIGYVFGKVLRQVFDDSADSVYRLYRWFRPNEIAPPLENNCLEVRAAYDIGSGATKTVEALVNICDNKIVEVLDQKDYPILYRKDLEFSQNGAFSERIKADGIASLRNAKKKYSKAKQHCAVATAAFRSAKDGQHFASQIHDNLGLPVEVLSQLEEGVIAYYGALSQGISQQPSPIVWDIGGGSMQLTFQDSNGNFQMQGNEIASQPFLSLVLKEISNKATIDSSPNPINSYQIRSAIQLAKKHLMMEKPKSEAIQNKLAQGSPVVGVGSIHNLVIQHMCNLVTQQDGHSCTKQELYKVITFCAGKTDEELLPLMKTQNREFVKSYVTNMILVYAQMDLLGIDKIQTSPTNNVEGLLLKGCKKP